MRATVLQMTDKIGLVAMGVSYKILHCIVHISSERCHINFEKLDQLNRADRISKT